MSSVKFRQINFDIDYENVVNLIAEWWPESDIYKNTSMPYMPSKAMFKDLWLQGQLIGIVGYDGNELIATYIGVQSPYLFNPFYKNAFDILWHVRKDHRKTSTSVKLVNEIEKLMKVHNVNSWTLSFSQDVSYDSVACTLQKKGYKAQDRNFLKFDRRLI